MSAKIGAMFASVLLRLLAVLLLVAANAFFVAAEFSLVSIRDTRLQQLLAAGRVGARTVQKLHARLDEVLNAVQFGITLASLALGWIGEPAIARIIEGWIGGGLAATVYSHAIAIAIAFFLITTLHVILGEVVPKSVALQKAENVALAIAGPMDVFMTLSSPFVAFMNQSSRLVLKTLGVRPAREGGVHSPEELKLIVTAARRMGTMPSYQEELILRSLELGEISVNEIMVPRTQIVSLPDNMLLRDALASVVEEQHSRVPVYDATRGPENIVGVLYSKDVSRWARLRLVYNTGEWAARLDRMRVGDIAREMLVIPETKPVSDLLQEFRRAKQHLAVVVDEFGSTVGLVTVEDVLEQVVGEIEDEFDVAPPQLAPGATTMELDGSVNIRDMETLYHVELPHDEGFETLAGFIMAHLQRVPNTGDSFEFGGRRFTVVRMQGHRIARVKIEEEKQVASG
jgi:putative hemolysin